MKGSEFNILVQSNKEGNQIPLGTEYEVYDKNEKLLGFVGVHRDNVVFASITPPVDLYTDDYVFVEKKQNTE